eukprot:440031-Prymnesium_polylepis.1
MRRRTSAACSLPLDSASLLDLRAAAGCKMERAATTSWPTALMRFHACCGSGGRMRAGRAGAFLPRRIRTLAPSSPPPNSSRSKKTSLVLRAWTSGWAAML